MADEKIYYLNNRPILMGIQVKPDGEEETIGVDFEEGLDELWMELRQDAMEIGRGGEMRGTMKTRPATAEEIKKDVFDSGEIPDITPNNPDAMHLIEALDLLETAYPELELKSVRGRDSVKSWRRRLFG